jgi:hypothetical protein
MMVVFARARDHFDEILEPASGRARIFNSGEG